MRRLILRLLVVLTVLLGIDYVAWRWLESVNWSAWWIALPLVLAETYLVVDVALLGFTVWRARSRTEAGVPPPGATADVLVATGDEPLDVVLDTVLAARAVRRADRTWLLDDGTRAEVGPFAAEHGLGRVSPAGRPHGPPADGPATPGAPFLLLLDAGQAPEPHVLDRTLGSFRDPRVAFVQLPRHTGAGPGEPTGGGRAALFHGPLDGARRRGRDGWDAALLCGPAAVLRREALAQPVASDRESVRDLKRTLVRTRAALRRARRSPETADPLIAGMLDDVDAATRRTRAGLRAGAPLSELTHRLQREVDAAARRTVTQDFAQIQADLAVIAALDLPSEAGMVWPDELASAVDRMSRHDLSPLAAVAPIGEVLEALSVDLPGLPGTAEPSAAVADGEGVATSLRLGAQGWVGVHHDEVLVHGPAAEDLGAQLARRARRTRGTVRALLGGNPLLRPGLAAGPRLVHLSVLSSSCGAVAALVWFGVPAAHLMLGVLPVTVLGPELFLRLVPFLVARQLLLLLLGGGVGAWREQLHELALFPQGLRAVTAAVLDVRLRRSPGTGREHGRDGGARWRPLRPQLLLAGVLAAALVLGGLRLALGLNEPAGTLVAAAWTVLDLAALSALVGAAGHLQTGSRKKDEHAVHG